MSAKIARAIDDFTSKPEATIFAIVIVFAWFAWAIDRRFDPLSLAVASVFTGVGPWIMCFALRFSAARDSIAMHAKIDAQTAAMPEADNRFIGAEKLADGKVEELHAEVCAIEPTALQTVAGEAGMV